MPPLRRTSNPEQKVRSSTCADIAREPAGVACSATSAELPQPCDDEQLCRRQRQLDWIQLKWQAIAVHAEPSGDDDPWTGYRDIARDDWRDWLSRYSEEELVRADEEERAERLHAMVTTLVSPHWIRGVEATWQAWFGKPPQLSPPSTAASDGDLTMPVQSAAPRADSGRSVAGQLQRTSAGGSRTAAVQPRRPWHSIER
eukprot:TRINITY_DN7045_c0_g2_i1.p1 TRINITY_DN7045_c0_g2~~TRINITY_DN7045_c0_g2_i1.p1  ORF type:complete len:200 (+),score=37.05 TRINITY_DN7045_c0_g2_i1:120-719(+)